MQEIRCHHPSVKLATGQQVVPDWILDKNVFSPRDGTHCSAWKKDELTDLTERICRLEESIREWAPVELNCLSNMGISFIEKAVKYYQDKQ